MYHDPHGPGPRRGWLSRFFAGEEDAAPAVSLAAAAPSAAAAEPDDAAMPDDAEQPADLAAMAEQLAQLIEQARGRLDGAVALVGRSADDAADYGAALASDAAGIGAAGLPPELATSLLGLTARMIERTQACESRLRATTAELRGLQRDLDEAQEEAERDPLTGLPNRRGMAHVLRCAIAAAQATDGALSVAFCDVDAFQRLIDVHGHRVGDRILRLVADTLCDGAGEEATVGRHGADEFVLVFDGVPAIEAAARIDAVRASLAARTLRSRSDGVPIGSVTFSAGVAGHRRREGHEEVFARADAALTRARQGGGNQVMIDTE